MTKPKMKSVIDFSTCHHYTKEGFQEESDFTQLEKSFQDGLQQGEDSFSSQQQLHDLLYTSPSCPLGW
jgi:hypothetical protein